MPKRGGVRKKRRTHVVEGDDKTHKFAPKCFVLKRGVVTQSIKDLIFDWRQLMSPYCALKLRESPHNKLADFVSVSSVFGVTHIISFSQTDRAPYMKFVKLPEGPTLSFKLSDFSLSNDVRSQQSKPKACQSIFRVSPVVVMNGFREPKLTSPEDCNKGAFPVKMLSTFIGNMYPAIQIDALASTDCRRVVLFHLEKETHKLTIRHYGLVQRQAGISKAMKRIIRLKSNPDLLLSHTMELSDLIIPEVNDNTSAESDDDGTEVNALEGTTSKVALGLFEIGPRVTADLVKIESGVGAGKGEKTKEELAELENREPELQAKRKRAAVAMESAGMKKGRIVSDIEVQAGGDQQSAESDQEQEVENDGKSEANEE